MKKIRWGVIFIILFFLLFLTAVGFGYYLFGEQTKEINSLRARLKALNKAQEYTQRKLEFAEKDISDLGLKFGSLSDSLKVEFSTFDNRLSIFDKRLGAQEKTTRDIYSKVEEVSSKVWSLEDKFQSLKTKKPEPGTKVDLGNISVEKK